MGYRSQLPATAAILGALALAAAVFAGCSAASHHRVLRFFFDGVPDRKTTPLASATPLAEARLGRQLVRPGEHGPYAAKLCDSCHDAKATNALIVPAEQLCNRCHDLGVAKRYVHGPLASGGCMVCHDPHRSPNRFLLVSASDGFCLHCHDPAGLSAIAGHTGAASDAAGTSDAGDATHCTECHDAHMSERQYLLR